MKENPPKQAENVLRAGFRPPFSGYPAFFHSKQIGTAQHPLQNCFHHPLISRVNPFFHRFHFTTLEVSHIEVSPRFPCVPQPLPHLRQVSASLDRSAARLADALKLAENLSGAQEWKKWRPSGSQGRWCALWQHGDGKTTGNTGKCSLLIYIAKIW